MSKLEFYCTEVGLYTSDKEASDFGKVPDPILSEIQEAQSASFSSFWDPSFKSWTTLAVRGSLHPLFKIRTDLIVRGSL